MSLIAGLLLLMSIFSLLPFKPEVAGYDQQEPQISSHISTIASDF
jgi:hypothetical protein